MMLLLSGNTALSGAVIKSSKGAQKLKHIIKHTITDNALINKRFLSSIKCGLKSSNIMPLLFFEFHFLALFGWNLGCYLCYLMSLNLVLVYCLYWLDYQLLYFWVVVIDLLHH